MKKERELEELPDFIGREIRNSDTISLIRWLNKVRGLIIQIEEELRRRKDKE